MYLIYAFMWTPVEISAGKSKVIEPIRTRCLAKVLVNSKAAIFNYIYMGDFNFMSGHERQWHS